MSMFSLDDLLRARITAAVGTRPSRPKPAIFYSRPSEQMPVTTRRLDTCGFHKKGPLAGSGPKSQHHFTLPFDNQPLRASCGSTSLQSFLPRFSPLHLANTPAPAQRRLVAPKENRVQEATSASPIRVLTPQSVKAAHAAMAKL
jgi:hypothetical protein